MLEDLLVLALTGILFVAPLLYFSFFAPQLFGIPRWVVLPYLMGLPAGFLAWLPLLSITLAIAWGTMILSWAYLMWNILRAE